MSKDYPGPAVEAGRIEPVPRRVRGYLGDRLVFDTVAARYHWEWPFYPQYHVPLGDVDRALLVDEERTEAHEAGTARMFGLRAGGEDRSGAARVHGDDAVEGLQQTVRFAWSALTWFEEDEQVFVHPRNPYTRVDAIRSARPVRVEVDGTVLAEAAACVMVYETGLPTRYYLDRTAVRLEHLVPSDTRTSCPYKGNTSEYWSARVGDRTVPDVAWSYDFPTRQLQPVTGLVAFLNEQVDIVLDGRRLERPSTHFSS